ncbi:diguanylate cyclase domain-containing protein [Roseateles sp.]|uniref:diguanylate cyclase domain-containing protein n=1 Tax=Roseateles sp. TaxID=1971397 RepID=UPI00286A4375|nr:diguanylate cyclase [Roseateles sp.]
MNPPLTEPTPDIASAEHELASVTQRVEAMRAVLVRLLQDVVRAETFLDQHQSVQLLEANEQLVLTALDAQIDSQSALQALDEAARAAGLDPLTKLANRALTMDRLEHAIMHAKRQGTRLALLFVDLDKFKQINDSFGHAAGDQVLQQVARCLLTAVRESDTVSRHGGDEFLILLDDLDEIDDALQVAEKLGKLLAQCRAANQNWGDLSASIGISIYPRDATTAEALIACADQAMYMAKRQGPGGVSFFVDATDPLELSPLPPNKHELGHEHKHLLLQEANQQLVQATRSVRELHAAAAAAQQRQGEFLDNVAGELNDPMSPIRIAMAVLGRPPEAAPLLPHAQKILAHQALQVRVFVDDLLKQDSIKAKPDDTLVMLPIELKPLLDHAKHLCQALLTQRRQLLIVEHPERALCLQGDALRLTQAFTNLLSNAIKYSHDRGDIRIRLLRQDQQAVIEISDAGIGITAQALQTIFEPFGQDPHALGLNGNGLGLGLGLTVVREIIEAHGGTVRASSAGVGQGSQFIVTLPLTDCLTA